MENKIVHAPLRNGTRPTRHDHRDFDFFKTKKFGGVIPTFPDSYSTDAGLWMPDQNEANALFTPMVPPLPEGCTNYAQSDLLVDEDKKLFNPMDIENITHANANGGGDIRAALKAVTKLHPDHPTFFAVAPDIQKGGDLDWFDACRVAMILGKPEGRAVSIGSPWFPEFMNPLDGIIQVPNWSITVPGTSIQRITWHNWAMKGWNTFNGAPYITSKPWIGPDYGLKGFSYFSRPIFNTLMNIAGTAAFTLDKLMPGENPIKIDSTMLQWLTSLFWQITGQKPLGN